MRRLRLVYLGSIVIFFLLAGLVVHQLSSQITSEVTITSSQSVAKIGEEIVGRAEIYNPSDSRKLYTYVLYFNGAKRLEDSISLGTKKRFQLIWRVRPSAVGAFKSTIVVYEGAERKLVENASYIIYVKP